MADLVDGPDVLADLVDGPDASTAATQVRLDRNLFFCVFRSAKKIKKAQRGVLLPPPKKKIDR